MGGGENTRESCGARVRFAFAGACMKLSPMYNPCMCRAAIGGFSHGLAVYVFFHPMNLEFHQGH